MLPKFRRSPKIVRDFFPPLYIIVLITWIHEYTKGYQNSQSCFCFVFIYFKVLHRPLKKNKLLLRFSFFFFVICSVPIVFIFYLRMYISLYSSFTSCKYSFFHYLFEKLNVMKQGSRFQYYFFFGCCQLFSFLFYLTATFQKSFTSWPESCPEKIVLCVSLFPLNVYYLYTQHGTQYCKTNITYQNKHPPERSVRSLHTEKKAKQREYIWKLFASQFLFFIFFYTHQAHANIPSKICQALKVWRSSFRAQGESLDRWI